MKIYGLNIPIAGYAYIEVKASSEEEAVQAAFEKGGNIEDLVEWDMYKRLIEGNVCYAPLTRVEVSHVEDIEDDDA